MKMHPQPQQVLDDLGDKFVQEFVAAMGDARDDYQAFREWRPDWMPGLTQRFVASLIHERMWASLIRRVDNLPDVQITDHEPKRQMAVGNRYVLRYKRHRIGDRISTYPTAAALRFWASEETLDGMDVVSLAMGYMWDGDISVIGETVLSYRDSKDDPVWCITVDQRTGGATGISWTPIEPSAPTLDLSSVLAENVEAGSE